MRGLLDTNVLIDKVATLLPALEERGTVYLFAFAQQPEIDRWDVVLSSKWSDQDSVAAVRFVADYMRPRFGVEELTLVSRIAVIPSDDPRLRDLTEHLRNITPQDNLAVPSRMIYNELLGSDIRQAFVFKAQPVLIESASGALAGIGPLT